MAGEVPSGETSVFHFLDIFALGCGLEACAALFQGRSLWLVAAGVIGAIAFHLLGTKWQSIRKFLRPGLSIALDRIAKDRRYRLIALVLVVGYFCVRLTHYFLKPNAPVEKKNTVLNGSPSPATPTPSNTSGPPQFSITLTGVAFCTTNIGFRPPITQFMTLIENVTKPGQVGIDTLYPVDIEIWIRITNSSPRPFVVDSYDVEFRKENGRWSKLCRLDTLHHRVFSLDTGIAHAQQVDLEACGFDRLISEKVLKWDDKPTEGIAFFEVARGDTSDYFNASKARITVHTADGLDLPSETSVAATGSGSLGKAEMVFMMGQVDLSHARRLKHAPGCFWKP
ncbi:MAG TPA: hypothetical protein VMF91_16485 [Bryobacteraceae bacterium]|nr:hypothetical protein [Bryobacteraceae bacterium]